MNREYERFVKDEKRLKWLKEYNKTLSVTKAAKALNIPRTTLSSFIHRVKAQAERQGYSPDHSLTKPVPEAFYADQVTTAYDEDGNVKTQWVRAKLDKAKEAEQLTAIFKAFAETVKVRKPTKAETTGSENYLGVIPFGDPHIGMFALADEAGEDWSIEMAVDKYQKIIHHLLSKVEHCQEVVLLNLGDYFHADNVAGVTTRSGHHLDVDKNYFEMIKAGTQLFLYMIDAALKTHQKVTVINAIGNHDDTASMGLQIALQAAYRNEPRVNVMLGSGPCQYIEFGDVLIGTHHGHTIKGDKLPLVMATDQAEAWGRTKFRHWYTGHVHHDTRKEYTGCTVETFRILPPKDAYANWGGYRAERDCKAIVLSKKYGEVERYTINIHQLD